MVKGSLIDIVVILIYFFAILLFGSWFGRYVKSTKDFFFGGQRFSWWLIAMSCIATVVGSYSFIKYSAVAYQYGFSSTMSYLNDWFILPLFVLGWLPIIYFNRIISIPEYFEKRFDKKTRIAGVIILLVYLIGYVGINLYTIGTALEPLIDPIMQENFGMSVGVMEIAVIISIICAVYMHAGGQTAVIMTDLVQGFILLMAGIIIFILGIYHIGGLNSFWQSLDGVFRLPMASFNTPAEFNHVGVFWQDAFGSTIAFYFMNQGVLMRFMSAKSPAESKKAIFVVVLVLMPLAAFAVSDAGWIGRSMVNLGLLDKSVNPNHIFVAVASRIAVPGLFGFLLAALTAALMSTIDTLINAVAAITVNDIVREAAPGRDDAYYLRWARFVSFVAAALGLLLVPVYTQFDSIYVAHGAFTAAITPPMIITILLGAFWKRFTTPGAFAVMAGGSALIILSLFKPGVIAPFDQGVALQGYTYMRALYGFVVCMGLGIAVSLITKPKSDGALAGLVIDSIRDAKRLFKGAEPNDDETGEKILCRLMVHENDGISLSRESLEKIKAKPGDIIYIADDRWWFGGIRSVQCRALEHHDGDGDACYMSENLIHQGNLTPQRMVVIEKVI